MTFFNQIQLILIISCFCAITCIQGNPEPKKIKEASSPIGTFGNIGSFFQTWKNKVIRKGNGNVAPGGNTNLHNIIGAGRNSKFPGLGSSGSGGPGLGSEVPQILVNNATKEFLWSISTDSGGTEIPGADWDMGVVNFGADSQEGGPLVLESVKKTNSVETMGVSSPLIVATLVMYIIIYF